MREKSGKRLWMGMGLLAIVGALGLLIGGGLKENMVFFLTPSELEAKGPEIYDRPLRLGGQVKPNSVEWNAEKTDLRFILQDDSAEIRVHSAGAPPAMFQEGIGVVVEGHYDRSGVFQSDRVMVKHSNEYSPPEDGESHQKMYETLQEKGEGS